MATRQADSIDSVRALIQKLRIEHGWTPARLATESGLPATTVYSILDPKRANYRIQPQTLIKLAHGLGISPHVLLLAQEHGGTTLTRLLDAWCHMDDATRESLVAMAVAMTAA